MADQRIVEYTFELEHNEAYLDLLRNIYQDYNHLESFVATKKRNKSLQNPFFQIGEITNFIAYHGSQTRGHISAIVDSRLLDDLGRQIGLIGFYECSDDENLSQDLIKRALNSLKQKSCRFIRGPIDLTTWHNYRFVLNPNSKNSFVLEPLSQCFYPNQFFQNGFLEARRYASLITKDLETMIEYGERVRRPLVRAGFKITRISPENFDLSMRRIFEISSRTFSENWSFIPISFEEFSYIYGEYSENSNNLVIETLKDPKGVNIGFVFSIHDSINDSLIIKSIAILPEYRYTFGGVMLGVSQVEQAKSLGLSSVTYALRHREKITKNPIYEGSEVVREYIALERELDS